MPIIAPFNCDAVIVEAAIALAVIVFSAIFTSVTALSAIKLVVIELSAISLVLTAFSAIIVEVTALADGKVSCGHLPIYAIMFAPCTRLLHLLSL